jgi:hypothetical protein
MNKLLFIFIITCFGFLPGKAQEFDFTVKVLVPNNLLADPAIYVEMENKVREFVNNTVWTNDSYKPHERIKGSIQITIMEEKSPTTFVADVIFQTVRPVYNSTYDSPILNYVDKSMLFNFNIGQPIIRSDNAFYDNLSSTLTYLMYLALAFDYDSFSPYGGESYFNMAREVYNSLPSGLQSGDPGWRNTGAQSNNKYWIMENMLNVRLRPFRQSYYEYHRLGLDKMAENAERNRAVIMSSLTVIDDVIQNYPNSIALQIFAEAKRSEILEIFKVADRGQKSRVRNTMLKIDPAQSALYDPLR